MRAGAEQAANPAVQTKQTRSGGSLAHPSAWLRVPMKKVALYSKSPRKAADAPRSRPSSGSDMGAGAAAPAASAASPTSPTSPTLGAAALPPAQRDASSAASTSASPPASRRSTANADASAASAAANARTRTPSFLVRHERSVGIFAALLLIALLMGYASVQPPVFTPTQKDIDASVTHTLTHTVLPSPESRAYEKLRHAVVQVRQIGHDDQRNKDVLKGVGSGVVIVDKGIILTSLHVVEGARKLQVIFDDGTVSTATIVNAQPENDLAVLKASTLPDDLVAATLRSTHGLVPGERVIAIGFPFDIGPSVSSGVISGLHRAYQSPDGDHSLHDLIQFDAAANPGNSGGPLATMDGDVVGIVTAILNPTEQGVFIGIGFAVPIENAAAAAGTSPF